MPKYRVPFCTRAQHVTTLIRVLFGKNLASEGFPAGGGLGGILVPFARCRWPHANRRRRRAAPIRITFTTSKSLGDFEFALTGSGAPGEWSVLRDDATQALAQTGTDPADDRFPLAIYRPFSARNVYVSIRFMPVSGPIDRAGGVSRSIDVRWRLLPRPRQCA